LHDTEGDTLAH